MPHLNKSKWKMGVDTIMGCGREFESLIAYHSREYRVVVHVVHVLMIALFSSNMKTSPPTTHRFFDNRVIILSADP